MGRWPRRPGRPLPAAPGAVAAVGAAALMTWVVVGACGASPTAEVDTAPADEPGDVAAVDEPDTLEADDTEAPTPDAEPPGPGPLAGCRQDGDMAWLPMHEASGAAWLGDGRVLVAADSGHGGEALFLDLAEGQTVPLVLPLGDGASDDIEGLATAPDGRVVGATSGGWLREWTVEGEVVTLARGPYAVTDPGDWLCAARRGNCKKNYEGLCLDPAPSEGGCVGFLASKTDGVLVCLRHGAEGYRLDPEVLIDVASEAGGDIERGPLSGCAYEPSPPHRLVVAGNIFTMAAIWEVVGHRDPATAVVERLPLMGAANQEAIVIVDGERMLSFGDLQRFGEGSPVIRFACAP